MTDSILRYIESNTDEICNWHFGPAYSDLISLSSQLSDFSFRLIAAGLISLPDDELERFTDIHRKLSSHIAVCRLVGYFVDEPQYL